VPPHFFGGGDREITVGYNACTLYEFSKIVNCVKLHLAHRQRHVRLSVGPLCLSRGVHPMGGQSAMLHENLREHKNPGSTNKYTKFVQLIIG